MAISTVDFIRMFHVKHSDAFETADSAGFVDVGVRSLVSLAGIGCICADGRVKTKLTFCAFAKEEACGSQERARCKDTRNGVDKCCLNGC